MHIGSVCKDGVMQNEAMHVWNRCAIQFESLRTSIGHEIGSSTTVFIVKINNVTLCMYVQLFAYVGLYVYVTMQYNDLLF